ncbi:MAG: hypothetical protein JWM63_2447 [Gammaproteobacteria bacterium]|jgi:hypothetical protein|nr:hypothetical protein [Gammaproteobacteria bacterium]
MKTTSNNNRLQFNTGPDPTRTQMVGFCGGCGCVLEPLDYLHCRTCYRAKKQTSRRYNRATARRQLEFVLERVKYVADHPLLFHWVPTTVILFGSMLKTDEDKVGDIDLDIGGEDAFNLGYESREDKWEWINTTPNDAGPLDQVNVPQKKALSFIRKGATLLTLTSFSRRFPMVGGGRPFPFKVVWTREGSIDKKALTEIIEGDRPGFLAGSIKERADSVAEQRAQFEAARSSEP